MLHEILMFSIVIPFIAGVIKLRYLDKSFQYFFVLISIGLVTDVSQKIFHEQHFFRVYVQIVYTFFEFFFISIIIKQWNETRKTFYVQWILLFFASCFDLYNVNKLEYTLKISQSIEPVLVIFISVPTLANEFSKSNVYYKKSRLLILFPLIISMVFDLMFDLSLWVAYSNKTHMFFIRYHDFLNIIQFLSYICYSLAFIWAPKKDKFLSL